MNTNNALTEALLTGKKVHIKSPELSRSVEKVDPPRVQGYSFANNFALSNSPSEPTRRMGVMAEYSPERCNKRGETLETLEKRTSSIHLLTKIIIGSIGTVVLLASALLGGVFSMMILPMYEQVADQRATLNSHSAQLVNLSSSAE